MQTHLQQAREAANRIRVVVVDDSPTARLMICRMLEADPAIVVVGTADNGREAVEQIGLLKPDLVTMDVNMPVMNGIAAIEQVMAYHPVPVLVVSSVVDKEHTANAARALGAGAVDVVCKPQPGSTAEFDQAAEDLRDKVRLLSRVKVITHPRARLINRGGGGQSVAAGQPLAAATRKARIIAIGSSTGGPQALQRILSGMPPDFHAGIVIVQHIVPGFTDGLVEWLGESCRLKVVKGRDGQEIIPGEVIVAPDGIHMTVIPGERIELVQRQLAGPHKPSVDILLESVAEVYGNTAIGVLLTGMGRDGAQGMKTIHDHGGATIAQDKQSSVIFSMAKEAIRLGGVETVAPLSEISQLVVEKAG